MVKKQKNDEKQEAKKRQYTTNIVVIDEGIKCNHCGNRYGHIVKNTYPNGKKRRVCGGCGLPFVSVRIGE